MPARVDGGSFKFLLEKGNAGQVHRPFPGLVFHRFNNRYPHSAIRIGDYKLVKFWKNDDRKLYNLKADLAELEDLAQQMPEKANALHEQLMMYLKQVNAETP